MEQTLLTFNEVLENGYTFPESVDSATAELITEWFRFRYTGKRFTEFFNRSLKLNYPYYRQLLRVDPTVTKYDWFVDNYTERQITTDETATNSGTHSETNASADNHTTTDSGSGTIETKTAGSGNSTVTYNSQDNDTSTQADNNRSTGFSRQAPMSGEYNTTRNASSLTAGNKSIDAHTEVIAYPNIVNPTATTDTLNEQSTAIDSTHAKTGQDTTLNSDSTNSDTTTTTSNTSNTAGTNNSTVNGSNSGTNTIDRVLQEIATGRNESIASLLSQATAVIENSRAWDYLFRELDKCFIQSFMVTGDEY